MRQTSARNLIAAGLGCSAEVGTTYGCLKHGLPPFTEHLTTGSNRCRAAVCHARMLPPAII